MTRVFELARCWDCPNLTCIGSCAKARREVPDVCGPIPDWCPLPVFGGGPAPGVAGDVVAVGDLHPEDLAALAGVPCIVIHSSRSALRDGPALAFKTVTVTPQPEKPI